MCYLSNYDLLKHRHFLFSINLKNYYHSFSWIINLNFDFIIIKYYFFSVSKLFNFTHISFLILIFHHSFASFALFLRFLAFISSLNQIIFAESMSRIELIMDSNKMNYLIKCWMDKIVFSNSRNPLSF
jgi:hypothetical protein